MRTLPKPDEAYDWPHVSNYMNICPCCDVSYYGPKRSSACWTCTGPENREWWERKQEG